MAVSVSWLRDDFADNVEAPCWSGSYTLGSATKAETGGRAVFTLPASTAGTHEAGYRSAAAYDLTADSATVEINQMVSTSVAAYAFFRLWRSSGNSLAWTQQSGTIKAQKVVDGVTTDLFSASWSSTTYKYLRIRESGGTIFFDSSSNGTSWTNRASVAIASAIPVTELFVQFGAGVVGSVASPGAFRVEAFNELALTSAWNWTEAEWPLANRFRSITLAATAGQGVIVTADSVDASGNLVAPRYFAGPLGSASGGYNALVEYATLSAAQAMAVNLPLDGRWDLPTQVECRVIRLYHRATTGVGYTLREFYPRRLIQADDIEAESIQTINLAANVVTADKIYATLTITGKTIQTDVSGARVVLSGATNGGLIGYDAADTYDPVTGSGTYQVLWKLSDGRLYAGGGAVALDENGVTFKGGTGRPNKLTYVNASDAVIADLLSVDSGSSLGISSTWNARSPIGSNQAQISLRGAGSAASAMVELSVGGGSFVQILPTKIDCYMTVNATVGLNVGPATGAGVGQIRSQYENGIGTEIEVTAPSGATVLRLYDSSNSIGSGSYFIRAQKGASDQFFARGDGVVNAASAYWVGGTQVVGSRRTGWGAPTGTATRTTFASGSVTLSQLAERVKALIDDLTTHGLIGS